MDSVNEDSISYIEDHLNQVHDVNMNYYKDSAIHSTSDVKSIEHSVLSIQIEESQYTIPIIIQENMEDLNKLYVASLWNVILNTEQNYVNNLLNYLFLSGPMFIANILILISGMFYLANSWNVHNVICWTLLLRYAESIIQIIVYVNSNCSLINITNPGLMLFEFSKHLLCIALSIVFIIQPHNNSIYELVFAILMFDYTKYFCFAILVSCFNGYTIKWWSRYITLHTLFSMFVKKNKTAPLVLHHYDNLMTQKHCIACNVIFHREDEVHIYNCYHIYHIHCIEIWNNYTDHCPACC